ncbi:MAG: uroporphyrinogen decarboxylase [Chloroflexi bacterium]|nr:uroporphyrinogen decarboxylase [Chloroflexota bacterium]
MTGSRFLRACRREPVDATPIWLMRQAGRYMSEYRALRERYSILEMIKTPELACEVTLQPMKAFDLDAAIIFADILPPLAGMGLELDFVRGEGPVIYNPIRCAADVDRLEVRPPEESLSFTLEAIKLARAELGDTPLIGFSGAPFTLACYAIEGESSKHHLQTKLLMWREPEIWHRLMSKFAEVAGQYLLAQARAGAQALQLFDSWVGDLSPGDYATYVLPYSQQALEIAAQSGVPIIHFGTNTSGMLDLIQAAGGDVIGVDWRIDLATAWKGLGERAIQGNLDPLALFAPWDELKVQAQRVLDQAGGKPGHIFNLGHGILPETPIENVRRLVDFVHEYKK